MSEFNEGDLVEVERGEELYRGRWRQEAIFGYLPNVALDWDDLDAAGYTVTVIEKAAPPLPTEPGHYEDANGRHWLHQIHDGSAYGAPDRDVDRWFNPDGVVENPTRIAGTLFLTKLEPVPVTAKRVLASIERLYGSRSRIDLLAEVAAEFGVTQ